MEIDRSAADLVLSYLDGAASFEAVWTHPAYQAIRSHADLFGDGLSKAAIRDAIDHGGPKNEDEFEYHGVQGLEANLDRVRDLIDHTESHEPQWIDTITSELAGVIPVDPSEVTIYPVIGYDVGIGIDGAACLNCNEPLFFESAREFLSVAIHETTHVLYDSVHDFHNLPRVRQATSSVERTRLFDTMLHTEGYAVYAPLSLRNRDAKLNVGDHVIQSDYAVVADEDEIASQIETYDALRQALHYAGEWTLEEYIRRAFGSERLPYRVGCVMLDRLAMKEGMDAVREAFCLDARVFVEEYDWVLDTYR